MRREPVKVYDNELRKYISIFFWRPCVKCMMEFRSEPGFGFTHWLRHNNRIHQYICGECATTLAEAEVIMLSQIKAHSRHYRGCKDESFVRSRR